LFTADGQTNKRSVREELKKILRRHQGPLRASSSEPSTVKPI